MNNTIIHKVFDNLSKILIDFNR